MNKTLYVFSASISLKLSFKILTVKGKDSAEDYKCRNLNYMKESPVCLLMHKKFILGTLILVMSV